MNGLYVIAGASGAIGRRLSQQVLHLGGTPVLVGRQADKLASVNEELGGHCPIVANVDFSDPTQAGKVLATELKGETLCGLACKCVIAMTRLTRRRVVVALFSLVAMIFFRQLTISPNFFLLDAHV